MIVLSLMVGRGIGWFGVIGCCGVLGLTLPENEPRESLNELAA